MYSGILTHSSEPIRSNNGHKKIGITYALLYMRAKVRSEGNCIDISEYRLLPVAQFELVANPAGCIGVGTTIRDNNLRHKSEATTSHACYQTK